MIQALLALTLNAPKIVSIVETLFHPKPKSGASKLAAAKQLALQALKLAEMLPAGPVAQQFEQALELILNGAVADANASGEFTHGTATPAPASK